MGFLPDDILMRDDTFSLFWKDQADCLTDQDDTFPYSGPVTGVLGNLSGKDLAPNTFFYDDSSYLPDPNPDPGITNGQTFNTTSTLQAAEDQDQDGYIESGFSSLSGSSFSSPFDTDYSSPANGVEWKHVGSDGIEWEHVEDVQLELNQDDILRRHSLDSLCVGTTPSADQESAVSYIYNL
jgi:hypothetical protein